MKDNGITISPYGFGNAPRGADPMGPTGHITNTYQPSPQAMALGRIVEALMDPRNAWMGMGMAGKFGSGLNKFLAKPGEFFNPPTMKYLSEGGSMAPKGPTALGSEQSGAEWAGRLAGAWERHDKSMNPALHPVLQERMARAMNLKPLGYDETMALRRLKFSDADMN